MEILGPQKFFQISTHRFTISSNDQRGFNAMSASRRSKSFLLEIDNIYSVDHSPHLKLHTNCSQFDLSTHFYRQNSPILNTKYQISRLITHFFKLQKVLPNRVRNKYFNLIRKNLLNRLEFISHRRKITNHKDHNQTKTFFRFTYKRYRFIFGIYIPCLYKESRDQKCLNPSPIILSNSRRACKDHQKYLFESIRQQHNPTILHTHSN